jgi:two-component system chemotaxis sensor kinase CheA
MPEFLEDAEARLRSLAAATAVLKGGAARGEAREEALSALLRDLHTLKGTSSTYGFEALARGAREAEDALAEGGRGSEAGIAALPEFLSRLAAALEEIRDLSRRLSGHGEAAAVPVPEHKVRHLRSLSQAVEMYHRGGAPEPVALLLRACRSLDHMPLSKLAEKYQGMLERVSHRLGKRIAFRATPEGLEMPPQAFAALDEPLVHLIRNAADHGIEPEGQRLQAGKDPVGHITLTLDPREDRLVLTLSDDGKGIETSRVAEKALSLGLVTADRLAAMSEEEKLSLIFASGLTTRDQDNDISGRGVGMDAVAAWAREIGGSISVASVPGKGTRMTLTLPPRFKAED